MWEQEPQLQRVLERLKLLLASHAKELQPTSVYAKQGELLLKQDAPAENLLLLTRGKVAIQIQHQSQSPHTLTVVEAEAVFGEMGLFGDGTNSTDVRVVDGPAELLQINGDDLLKALIYDSELLIELLSLVSERVHNVNKGITLLLDGINAACKGEDMLLDKVLEDLKSLNHHYISNTAQQLKQLYKKNK
ncbi:MAG: cyclic nucleotide-binding domain-containing protein [Prochlorococcaceae cyanobacterium ETNP14_MAG_4]|nr:cyclic nucleotide-binding domain-containing protein [Prochlorococcaceae cyanobacterium ETNP14_MAG_4]